MTSSAPKHTTRRRTVIGAALGIVLIGVLVAIVVNRSNGAKVINAGGDTLVLVGKKTSDSMAALGQGRLADVGGCLGWAPTEEDTGPGTVIIWPHGTTVQTPDPLRVRVAGKDFAIGDELELGGGFIGPLDEDSYFYDQVPAACRTATAFLAG